MKKLPYLLVGTVLALAIVLPIAATAKIPQARPIGDEILQTRSIGEEIPQVCNSCGEEIPARLDHIG